MLGEELMELRQSRSPKKSKFLNNLTSTFYFVYNTPSHISQSQKNICNIARKVHIISCFIFMSINKDGFVWSHMLANRGIVWNDKTFTVLDNAYKNWTWIKFCILLLYFSFEFWNWRSRYVIPINTINYDRNFIFGFVSIDNVETKHTIFSICWHFFI